MKIAIRLVPLLLLIAVAWPAAAAVPQVLECRAVGTLGDFNAYPDGGYLQGSGTCTGGLTGPYTVTIFTPWGSGGVVPCITLNGEDSIPVTVSLTNAATGTTTTQVQEWKLDTVIAGVPAIAVKVLDPAEGFPAIRGAGVIVTRVLAALTCHGIGHEQPSATFEWLFVK